MLLIFVDLICFENVDCDMYNVFYCLYIECKINLSIQLIYTIWEQNIPSNQPKPSRLAWILNTRQLSATTNLLRDKGGNSRFMVPSSSSSSDSLITMVPRSDSTIVLAPLLHITVPLSDCRVPCGNKIAHWSTLFPRVDKIHCRPYRGHYFCMYNVWWKISVFTV